MRMITAVRYLKIIILVLVAASAGTCTRSPGGESQSPALRSQALSLAMRLANSPCDSDEQQRVLDAMGQATRQGGAHADSFFAQVPYLAKQHLLSNEMHDCQRLIREDYSYGPLVAIWVATNVVDRFNQRLQAGVALADIMNWGVLSGPDGYGALGIKAGVRHHCLWVRGNPAQPASTWAAAMRVPAGQSCDDGVFNDSVPLHVVRVPARGGAGGNYPSTGRWEWDDAGKVQFIGIRCGDAWCDFGPQTGFQPDTPYDTPADAPGWRDEQFLALPGGHAPSRLWATMIPASVLSSASEADFDAEPRVAQIVVADLFSGPGPDPAWEKYQRIFHLTMPATDVFIKRSWKIWPISHAWGIRARSNSDRASVYREKHQHSGPGTARWRWAEGDEQAWFYCGGRCCTAREM